jgi:hypothetical protein
MSATKRIGRHAVIVALILALIAALSIQTASSVHAAAKSKNAYAKKIVVTSAKHSTTEIVKLSPKFKKTKYKYSGKTSKGYEAVFVSATKEHKKAKLYYSIKLPDSNRTEFQPLTGGRTPGFNINSGSVTIWIKVVAQNKKYSKTYKIVVK